MIEQTIVNATNPGLPIMGKTIDVSKLKEALTELFYNNPEPYGERTGFLPEVTT